MTRKLAELASDSSLSPPPDDLETSVTALEAENDLAVKAIVNGKKRKAETVVAATKRARKTNVKDEVNDDTGVSAGAEAAVKSKPKKRTAKVKTEEKTVVDEIKVEAGEDGTTVKTKTKRQRKKKEEVLQPLEERTVGNKLRVGAHVSIAGGECSFWSPFDLT